MVLQFNQPNLYNQAFTTGYSMMDKVVNDAKTSRLRSKLSELYTSSPDMTYSDRLKKASGLMAVYGEPLKALEIDSKLYQSELAAGTKQSHQDLLITQLRGKPVQTVTDEKGKPIQLNVFGEVITPENSQVWKTPNKPIANKLTKMVINGKNMVVQVSDDGNMNILGEAPATGSPPITIDDLNNLFPTDKKKKDTPAKNTPAKSLEHYKAYRNKK